LDFRRSLTAFFRALYRTVASTDLLFSEPLLNDNVQVWISTLSGAASRPFRHTATVVALTITSALCEIGKGLAEKKATNLRQIEGEAKNKRPNKGRIADWNKEADASAAKITQLEVMIQDWFDTVFVHRYRDVDPKIRHDSIAHLGDWVMTYPDKFFDSQHQRYLGWVLSDSAAATRVEALKQLHRFFKDNSKLGGLRQFTERFRPRIIEIVSRDNDITARIAALELMNTLRSKGLLEPNDIDTIGKLIFDSEARVRKVVVDFFAASVEETYAAKVEELGGLEALEEILPPATDGDTESPRLAWLRIKCLAELLLSYDADEDNTAPLPHNAGGLQDVYNFNNVESRLSLAAQSLIEKIPDLNKWDVLAGYLLHDHSSLTSNDASDDLFAQAQSAYKLEDKEEVILLDVLNASVIVCLAQVAENTAAGKAKMTKRQLSELHEGQEAAAQRLAATIPKLLKKFGASPESARAVLRLERVLNLDIFEQLRQDSTTYSTLLDDINKQFLTHENLGVLAEARTALLHARSFEELEEVTDSKLAVLWDDTIHALTTLCRGEDMSARGTIHQSALAIIASTVLRISNLASISDCRETLETPRSASADQPRRKQRVSVTPITPIDALIASVGRGVPVAGIETERVGTEDLLTLKACESATFYFLWTVQNMQSKEKGFINPSEVTALMERKNAFTTRLRDVIVLRHGADDLRIAAAGALLDLHIPFATLRGIKGLEDLIRPIDAATQAQILRVFVAAEADFAKKTGKALNLAEAASDVEPERPEIDDKPPAETRERVSMSPASSIDSGPEDAEDDEADEPAELRKQHAALISEQRLCEFTAKCVLAVIAGVIDAALDGHESSNGIKVRKSKKAAIDTGKLRSRIMRNAGKFGANFKAIVGAMQTGGAVASRNKKRGGAAAATTPSRKAAKSKEVVISDEDEEEEEVGGSAVEDEEAMQRAQPVEEPQRQTEDFSVNQGEDSEVSD